MTIKKVKQVYKKKHYILECSRNQYLKKVNKNEINFQKAKRNFKKRNTMRNQKRTFIVGYG